MTSTPDQHHTAYIAEQRVRHAAALLARLLAAVCAIRDRTDSGGTITNIHWSELRKASEAAEAFFDRPAGLEVDLARIRDLDPTRMTLPPVLEGIPAGMSADVFEVALAGAACLDALAVHSPYLRNVVGHALVELYREGWLSDHAARGTLRAAARAQQAAAAPRDPVDELIAVRLAAAGLDHLPRADLEPGYAFTQTIAGIACTHHALAYDAYDREIDRAITIIAATRAGLIPVAYDRDVPPRGVRGTLPPTAVSWPIGTDPATIARTILDQHRDTEADARETTKPVELADLARKLDALGGMVRAVGDMIKTLGGAR
jgi:hypothetical protein